MITLTRAALALALLALPSGCQALEQVLAGQRPTASLANVGIADLDLEALTLAFDVAIGNPYTVDLPIAALDYSLASGGQALLSGTAPDQGVVPAGGSRTLPLTVRVRFADVLAVAEGLRLGQSVPYEARLGVGVDAPGLGRLRLPVQHDGELPLPALPRVRLENVAWSKVGLTSAKADLRLALENPNDFALDLSRLNLGLQLGGHSLLNGGFDVSESVAAGGAAVLDIPIQLDMLQLGAAALSVLTGSSATYGLTGDLAVGTRFGALSFPLDASGQVPFTR